jgi:hypothetical protein
MKLATTVLVLLLVTPAFADTIDLKASGTPDNYTNLGVGQTVSQSFTLFNASDIESIYVGIAGTYAYLGQGSLGSVWDISIDDSMGNSEWSSGQTSSTRATYDPSLLLPAGTYEIEAQGIACNDPCGGNVAAQLDFYHPVSNFATGGSIAGTDGWGWEVRGDSIPTTPEPGTATLLGTALLGLVAVPWLRSPRRKRTSVQ